MGWIKYVKSTARWRGVFSSINHEHERKEGDAEDWARTFSGESVWRRPRWDLFSCELCKFCPFPANGSAPHCITEHLYSSKWKKEQKDIGKEIFSIIQRAAGAKEYGVQQIVRQKVSVTQWWFFFSPTPGFIVLTLQREWIAEIPSLKSHKMKSKTGKKFSCINKCFFMLLLVVVPGVVFLVVVQSLQLFFSSATSTLSQSAMWQLPLVKWSPVYSDCLPGEGQRREKAVDCVARLVNPPQKASIWIVK